MGRYQQTPAMIPPRYTKSVTVTSHGGKLTVAARFGSNREGAEDEVEVVKLEAGGSHTFKERSEDMGSWQAVKKVLSIEAKGDAKRRCGKGLAKTTVRESMVGSTIISMWLKRSLDLRPEMGKIFERCENYYKATALKCTLFDTSKK